MIALGQIISSQGNKGELKLRFFGPGEKDLSKGVNIYIEEGGNLVARQVEALRKTKKGFILKISGLDTLEEAKRLRGKKILVDEENLPHLEEGEFYEYQLIGASVRTTENVEVGKVAGFWEFQGKTLMVLTQGEKEVLIPFEEAICSSVDVVKKIIIIEPPEGLLNLNEV